ncbi:MAG TPA: hypothetical protein VHH88_03005 [Verrucomicrobiae bacterium]|nr:hypothetical protein [Verrucomicrobiae bacterium]
MGKVAVRKFWFIWIVFGLAFLSVQAVADTYHVNGEALNGTLLPASANDQNVQVKLGEEKYQKVPWGSFSQEDLRKFRDNPKLTPFVEPFIEITPEERAKKTEVPIKQPPRLERPPHQFILGAMFSSPVGIAILLVLYGATILAGYEVALFRAQSVPLVAGLSAIPFLGFFAPIIFLSIPTRLPQTTAAYEAAPPAEAAAPVPEGTAAAAAEHTPDAVNPMQGEPTGAPSGLRLHTEPQPAAAKLPEPVVFQRGQFTFNRRFIETKFAGFFGPVRRDADRDMVLVFKALRGEYVAERISRIAANDVHLQVTKGEASQEVMVPFSEIKEIILKHKDAA